MDEKIHIAAQPLSHILVRVAWAEGKDTQLSNELLELL